MQHEMKPTSVSTNAAHFSNNTDQFGFDAELHQSGKNKAPLFHFHDFYEFAIYLGNRHATGCWTRNTRSISATLCAVI